MDFHHSKPTPPAPRSPSPPPHNPLSSKDKPARPPQPTSPPPPPAAPKIMGNRRYQLKGRNGNWSYQLDRQTKNESSPPPPPPRRPREAASGNLAARPVSPATRRPRNAGPCGSPARRPASRRPATGRSPEAPRLPVGQPDRSPPPLGPQVRSGGAPPSPNTPPPASAAGRRQGGLPQPRVSEPWGRALGGGQSCTLATSAGPEVSHAKLQASGKGLAHPDTTRGRGGPPEGNRERPGGGSERP